jgi:iron(III) transport system substrate-binding protein
MVRRERGERTMVTCQLARCGGAAVIAISALLATALPTPAQQLSPAMQSVVAAANKEGTLKVVWPGTLLGGARGLPTIEKNMNKMFGTNIKVSHTPTGSLIQQGFQLVNEAKANAPASTDIYIAVVNVFSTLSQNKVLLPVDWPALLPDRITDKLVELDSSALRIATGVYGVTYNTKLIPNPPKTLEGWLDPSLKGKIATNPQGVGFDYLLANDVMGTDKALDFVKRFSPQIGGLIFCTEQNRVASGEFPAMMFDCGPSEALRMNESGLPVDQLLLRDFLPVTYFYGTIPKNSPHPNAAKVLLAYLMTEEGQRLQWDLWRADLHLLPGSRAAQRIDAAVKDGAKPLEVTAAWYMAHPEVDAGRAEVVKIIREGH